MEKGQHNDDNKADQKQDTSENSTDRIVKHRQNVEFSCPAKFRGDMFCITELKHKGNVTRGATSQEWEDSVGSKRCVIDAEALADDDVGRVAHKKHHARRVCGRELRDEPCDGFKASSRSVIHEESGPREDDGVVPDNHTDKGEKKVEVEVELATVRAAFVADPECSCLKDPRHVQCNSYICQRDK